MKISAVEEYGLRCLLQLARTASEQPLVSAEEIAIREGLSVAYVEKILSQLRKAGLVKSVRGMYGGYQLARPADDIRVGDLVRGGLTVPVDASILFQMLSEVGSLPQQQQIHSSFRRLTVSFPSRNFRYILSRDETHVYIVQVKKSMG